VSPTGDSEEVAMKVLSILALAALGLATQTIPAFGSTTATITLIPLSTTGLVTASDRCNKPAAVDGDAYVDVPEIATLQSVGGTTLVKIDLTAKGMLADEALFESSGNVWLDRAALESPKMARFTPQVANCTSIGGSYLYEVEF
jgi:TonB family protein